MGTNEPASDTRCGVDASQVPLPTGPDWTTVPFAVPCMRCGADLRGRAEPRCPECEAAFSWDDLLRCPHCDYRLWGLTQRRCPECGRSFVWDQVLAAARSRRNTLFEGLWYHDPVPALLRTWWLAALRPSRLWAQFSRFDRPRIAPLLLFVMLQWLVFAYGWPVMGWLADAAMNGLADLLESHQWIDRPMRFTYLFRPRRGFLPRMALWYLMTFLCFQLLVQSKIRFRIGWRHILRVYVHATAFASLCTALWCVLEMLIDASLFLGPVTRGLVSARTYLRLGQAVFVLGVTVTWAHIWIGYRRHLQVPRAWGSGAMCLLLGYLLAELVMIYV